MPSIVHDLGRLLRRIVNDESVRDIDQAKLDAAQAKFGTKARAKRVDITKPEEVERAAKEAKAAMGPCRHPGVQRRRGWVERRRVDYPMDVWKRVFDTNINGLF
jgi:2-dehydro-3-deoxy-L-rhamnonate dehydrogenase (NAD+)